MNYSNPFFKPRAFIPAIGTLSWLMIYDRKRSVQKQLNGEIVQRVLEHLRNNPEIMEAFGYDFRLKTNMLTTLVTNVSTKGPFGDGNFQVRTPRGVFAVSYNTSSQTYENIVNSPKPALAKAKYDIPDQAVVDKIQKIAASSGDSKAKLEEIPMNPQTRFWAIDFINVAQKKGFARSSEESIVIKPSSQPSAPSTVPDYKNLYSLFTELQKAKSDQQKVMPVTYTDDKTQSAISNFRMREPYDKRIQLFGSMFYFGLLGMFWYMKAKPQFRVVSISNSVVFNKSSDMIRKKFAFDHDLIFNNTSIGGALEDSADYRIQFAGSRVQGIGKFKINHLSTGTWDFELAEVTYAENGKGWRRESIMEFVPEENLFWRENPKIVTRKEVTHS